MRRLLLFAFPLALVLAAAAAPAGAAVEVVPRDEPVAAGRTPAAAGERVLPPRATPGRVDLIGLHFRGSGRVWFRTAARPGGPWSEWHHARPEDEDLPDRGSPERRAGAGWAVGNPYWVGGARVVQYRLEGGVSRLRAYFVRSPIVRDRRAPTIADTPAIVSREGWGANESIVRGAPYYADTLRFAVVHHTAGATPASPEESAAIVRAIQAYHVKGNGWNDIGYNFLVDPFGQVFEGRVGGVERNVVGAHAEGFNTGSVGVAVLGTYGASAIAPEAQDAVARLLAWRLDVGHVDPIAPVTARSYGNPRFPAGTPVALRAVSGHRDTGFTSCPGNALYGQLGAIAQAAAGIGLPKLYEPVLSGGIGGPVRFRARLSEDRGWTVAVTDDLGVVVASGSGSGSTVDWTWDATGVLPAGYVYTIAAGDDVRPAIGTIGGPVALSLGAVRSEPNVITPNGDGLADETAISFTLTKSATVAVTLVDAAGAQIATVAPERLVAAGPVTVPWNGVDVADGRYRLVVSARADGRQVTRRGDVLVDRTLGALTASPAVSPNGDGRLDLLTVGFDLARDAQVAVRVLAGSRAVARVFAGTVAGGGRQTLTWNGRKRLGPARDGDYLIEVAATTSLGTRRLVAPFTIDRAGPRIRLVSARATARGATLVRFDLSEAARVKVWLDGVGATVQRGEGPGSYWRRGEASQVRMVAWDAAGNASAPVRARVRARG
jgi:hypothetical protein